MPWSQVIHQFMNRITGFGVSCLVMATAGCLGAFSVISDGLRERFQWTFSQVNLVNAIGNASLYLAYLGTGPLYDKYGERWTMFAGMLTFTFGYVMIWVSFRGIIETNVFLISLYYFIAGIGSSAAYLVGIGANAMNFDQKIMGIVTGVLLLFYGVSGTIYSQIYSFWYATANQGKPDIEGYLLFTTLSILFINTIGILFIQKYNVPKKIYPVVHTTINSLEMASPTETETTTLLSPLPSVTNTAKPAWAVNPTVDSTALIQDEEEPSMTPKAILKSKVFWMYAFICIMGQGLTYMATVNAIVRSSAPNAPIEWYAYQTTLHVTLCSIAQSIGRLLFGVLSDVVSKFGYDRTVLLIVAQVILLIPPVILSLIPLTMDNTIVLALCSVLVGLGFGASGGLFPAITRTLFGPKYYGTASSFVMVGVPIGIFSTNAAYGYLYDSQLEYQRNQGGPSDFCYGSSCFQVAHIFTASLQLIPVILSMILYNQRKQIR